MSVTPESYGISPYSGRSSDGIYIQKRLNHNHAEIFMVKMRNSYAIEICGIAEPDYPETDQAFLIKCQQVFNDNGEEGLLELFKEFALYVCKNINRWTTIEELNNYNKRVLEYNIIRAKEIGITYNGKLYDPMNDILKLLKTNWSNYWGWDGSDTFECGRSFIRSNRDQLSKNVIEGDTVFRYFTNNLASIYLETLEQNISI